MTFAAGYVFNDPSNTIVELLGKGRNKTPKNSIGKYMLSESGTAISYAVMENITPILEPSRTAVSLPFSFDFETPLLGTISRINIELDLSSTAIGESVLSKYSLLRNLVKDYLSGEEDIPGLAKRFSGTWTVNNIILLLESLGVYREPFLFQISKEDEEIVLDKLARIRTSHLKGKYDNESWIRREVIASQRIESVYVFDEDFAE